MGASAQENGELSPEFECPEPNGKFRDSEQCDLFYICRKGVATIEFCPEGLLFDDKIPKCERANGVFNFPDENVCDKYIQCDNGNAFEFPCPAPLVFDTLVGSCVRKEQASEEARRCDGEKV